MKLNATTTNDKHYRNKGNSVVLFAIIGDQRFSFLAQVIANTVNDRFQATIFNVTEYSIH